MNGRGTETETGRQIDRKGDERVRKSMLDRRKKMEEEQGDSQRNGKRAKYVRVYRSCKDVSFIIGILLFSK